MIPTLIVLGLVLGRWWWLPLGISAVGWPILLVATGVMDIEPGLLAASGLAVLNAGVGVLVHQGILWTVRQVRRAMNSSRTGDAGCLGTRPDVLDPGFIPTPGLSRRAPEWCSGTVVAGGFRGVGDRGVGIIFCL